MRLAVIVSLAIVGCVASDAHAQTSAAAPDREIVALGSGLHGVRAGKSHTVFLVTEDGILLADPLGVDTARWIAKELAAQFPGVPVRYVVLTHHHPERAAGGAVFAKTAQIVTQALFGEALTASRSARPNDYRYVIGGKSTVERHQTIAIGGATVDLIHVGPSHSPEMLVLSFPSQRIVFAVDPPPLGAPFRFGSFEPAHVMSWLAGMAGIDFDSILFGDGTSMSRADLASLFEYLSAMRASVLAGYARGQSLDELQGVVLLNAYRALPHYAARLEQIAAMYRRVDFARIDVTLTGIASYRPENSAGYCGGYDFCTAGGAVPAGSAALAVQIGHRFGIQGELTLGDQFWSSRTHSLYDEEIAFRPSRGALLVRYNLARSGTLSLLGGASRTVGSVRGLDRVRGRLSPIGGRHAIASRDERDGITVGVELSRRMGPFRVVLPLRVTRIRGELPAFWPGRIDVSAGAGLALPLFRWLQ